MPLNVGSRLAHYDVTTLIGEGGMGQVYQATDTKLNRQVALKILPEAFAADPDRLARFQREAQVLASLNHSGIAAIYGIEEDEAEGTRALVLELVEGPTLADRIAQGPIPLDEALPIAKQIAEALEAAHEAGVIHRDLKPANIKVRDDGTVKVLDFGLAKALDTRPDSDPSQSPTLTAAATQMGMIMGTPAYMSPEQARGKTVDKRADIWAFGVVLLEMLTGRKVFEGEDVSMTLSRVLQREPDWSHVPSAVSPSLSIFLHRCLEKDPKRRLGDIHDVRLAMEGAFENGGGALVESTAPPQLHVWQRPVPAVVSALALLVIGGLAVWAVTRSAPAAPDAVTRFPIGLPSDFVGGLHSLIALSPDGTHLVYASNDQLYLRDMDQMEAIPIRGTEGAVEPFFSPDGRTVGFWADGQLKKVALTGGPTATLGESVEPFGLSWGPDDAILFGSTSGVWRVPASGGTPQLIIPQEASGGALRSPQLLPGGEWVLFTVFPGIVVIQALATDERLVLTESGGSEAKYLPTGHLVYVREGTLLAQPFDIEQRTLAPGPVPLVERIHQLQMDAGGQTQSTHSDNGSLAYVVDRSVTSDRTLALVGRDGAVETLAVPPAQYLAPRVSPDGGKLVVQTAEDDGGVLWLYDLAGDAQIQQLTFEGDNQRPIWTPDGQGITFSSDREGTMSLYSMPADGSGAAERLTTADEGTAHWPGSWAPAGQTLLFNVERNRVSDWDIWTLSSATLETQSLYDTPDTVYWGAELSANGQWLAYGAGTTGLDIDIYVEPFPPTGSRPHRISQNGAYWPLWSPDGDRLFYRPISIATRTQGTLRSVDVVAEPDFAFRNEQTLPIEGFITVPFYRDYDLTPDGERFVMVFSADQTEGGESLPPQINVVLNWDQELLERVPIP